MHVLVPVQVRRLGLELMPKLIQLRVKNRRKALREKRIVYKRRIPEECNEASDSLLCFSNVVRAPLIWSVKLRCSPVGTPLALASEAARGVSGINTIALSQLILPACQH